jgi:hypothetical protein
MSKTTVETVVYIESEQGRRLAEKREVIQCDLGHCNASTLPDQVKGWWHLDAQQHTDGQPAAAALDFCSVEHLQEFFDQYKQDPQQKLASRAQQRALARRRAADIGHLGN